MGTIQVEPDQFLSAAADFYRANESTAATVSALGDRLAGCARMAGSDSGGVSWASAYDESAAAGIAAAGRLSTNLGSVGDLLKQTGANHAGADSASTPGGSGDTGGGGYSAISCNPSRPPSASGGSAGEPRGWSLIAHLLAYTWPNGDTGKLRTAAMEWHSSQVALADVSPMLADATRQVGAQRSPEVAAAERTCTTLERNLTELSGAFGLLGDACEAYAQHLDDAHHEVISELVSLVEWTVAIEAGGALLGIVTAGIGEAGAQAAEAARIAATATRVGVILERFIEAAANVGRTIAAIGSRIAEIVGKLEGLLMAPVRAALRSVARLLPRTAAEETAAEQAAAERAMYERYRAAKAAKGKTPKSFDAWKKLKDLVARNKAAGDAYEKEVMAREGITPGRNGWQRQYHDPETPGGTPRYWDYANPDTKVANEVKSGTTPVKEGLEQLGKDEKAVRRGWQVNWNLKKELSPTLMKRLDELAAKYPQQFRYSIEGK